MIRIKFKDGSVKLLRNYEDYRLQGGDYLVFGLTVPHLSFPAHEVLQIADNFFNFDGDVTPYGFFTGMTQKFECSAGSVQIYEADSRYWVQSPELTKHVPFDVVQHARAEFRNQRAQLLLRANA